MDSDFSMHFLNNMGGQQVCPLSPTLFGLFINKYEEIVNKVAKGGLDDPTLMYKLNLYSYMLMMLFNSQILWGRYTT